MNKTPKLDELKKDIDTYGEYSFLDNDMDNFQQARIHLIESALLEIREILKHVRISSTRQ